MRLPKWLLLQMLQTRITCSKKEGDIAFFFCYNTPQKRQRNIKNVAKMLPKLGFVEKEKLLNRCSTTI